ncbi:GAF/PAS/PAC adenylate/guanylate cyclase [Chloropicon primus]|uniref:GAF/PAS/PAC adenylate/guanylate cyclase n=1 Tax=Chloropicon primus TaxID=1764295 RepID=A0A5B8MBS1_9CHLO|nr:GAF/PAS/PAC adenylate/guanylate cyclase [Chloropicon primus]UPQ96926.1 GAF/PAS/PAC adenylate/guanylate cyclase [Chloropicon primus]|eukprot:QDZ17709.1 GAF/PAS/PAC adenylate/guanylate cyclase [Chloropicon primus]
MIQPHRSITEFDILTRTQKRESVNVLINGYKYLLPALCKTPEITKKGSALISMQKVIRTLHEVLHCDKVLFLANSSDKSALHYVIEAVRKHNNMKISMTTKFPGVYENHRPQTAPSEAMPVIIQEVGENGGILKFLSGHIKNIKKTAAAIWIPMIEMKKVDSGNLGGIKPVILGAMVAYYDGGYAALEPLDNPIGSILLSNISNTLGALLKNSLASPDYTLLRNQLQSIKSLIELISRAETVEEVAEFINDRAQYLLSCDQVRLFVVEQKRGEMWHMDNERAGAAVQKVQNRLDNSIVGQCATTGQVIKEANALENIRYNPDIDGDPASNSKMAILCLPILMGENNVIGVLRAAGRPAAFQQHEILSLGILAKEVEMTVQCQHLKEVASTAVDATVAAQSHAREIIDLQSNDTREVDVHKVIKQRIDPAKKLLGADRCTVFVVDNKKNMLISKYRSDKDGIAEEGTIEVPLGHGLASHAATTGEPVVIADAYLDPRFNNEVDKMTGYRTGSVLVVPIRKKGTGEFKGATVSHKAHPDVIGVVQMINKNNGVFSTTDLQTLQAFAASAVGVIESGSAIDLIKREVSKMQKKSADLLEVGRSLFVSQDLSAMVRLIMKRAKELLEADRCTLFLLDHDHNEIYSNFTDNVVEIRVPIGVGIAGAVAQTGERIVIQNAYEDSRFNREMDEITGYVTRSILAVPIKKSDGSIMGVVQMINKRNHEGHIAKPEPGCSFDQNDIELLVELSSQAGVALENNESMSAVMRAQSKSKELFEVAQALNSQREMSQLFTTIMDRAKELLHVDRCTLFLVDEIKDELWSLVANGTEEIRIPKHSGIVGAVVSSKKKINIQDAYLDERFNPDVDRQTGYRTKSVLCMPIFSNRGSEEVIGVMQMINKIGNYEQFQQGAKQGLKIDTQIAIFTQEDEDLINALSSQVAIAVENATVLHRTLGLKKNLEKALDSSHDVVLVVDPNYEVEFRSVNEKIDLPLDFFDDLRKFSVLEEAVDMAAEGKTSMGYMPASSETEGKTFKYCIKPMEVGALIMLDVHANEDTMMEILSKHMSTRAMSTLVPLLSKQLDTCAIVQVAVLAMRLLDSSGKPLGMLKHNKLYNQVMETLESNSAASISVTDTCLSYAFFSDPHNPDSWVAGVNEACRCGLEAVQCVERYNEEFLDETRKVRINIGLDKGQADCGIVGVISRGKGNLVVEGDVFDTAEDCMHFCELYHCEIIVSESCFAFSRDSIHFRELDSVKLTNGTDITVHELVGHTVDTIHDDKVNTFKYYKNGLSHYRERRWKLASEAFHLGKTMGDKACGEMHSRCIAFMDYLSASPQQGWNGVWSSRRSVGCYANIH